MQLHGLIAIADFRLGLNARIGIAVATEEFLNVILHFGHFGAVIQLARLNFGQRFDFCRMPRQVTRHLHTGKLVLIAFGNVDGDVDAFLVRRQAHLRGVNVETSIAAIQIVAAQRFKISRQLLFLIFTIAHHVPPRHFIAQLEGRNEFIGAECVVADDIDLLDFRRDAFLEYQLQVDTVTRQRRHDSFNAGAVFTDAVVEILQPLFDISQRGAIEGFPYAHAGCLKVLLEHVIFHRLVTGESDAGNRWTLFHLHQQGITIAQDANVLKVAGGKQSTDGVTDIIIGYGIARTHWHTEEGRTNSDSLKAFEMNVLHHEPVSTVYGCAAKQQRRYEQLFHRHRYYAFFLTNSLTTERNH